MADVGHHRGRSTVVTAPPLPLELTYAAIFRTRPGAEVTAALSRLDRYLGPTLTLATALLLLCISLRPIDLYASLSSASERQLNDARRCSRPR